MLIRIAVIIYQILKRGIEFILLYSIIISIRKNNVWYLLFKCYFLPAGGLLNVSEIFVITQCFTAYAAEYSPSFGYSQCI